MGRRWLPVQPIRRRRIVASPQRPAARPPSRLVARQIASRRPTRSRFQFPCPDQSPVGASPTSQHCPASGSAGGSFSGPPSTVAWTTTRPVTVQSRRPGESGSSYRAAAPPEQRPRYANPGSCVPKAQNREPAVTRRSATPPAPRSAGRHGQPREHFAQRLVPARREFGPAPPFPMYRVARHPRRARRCGDVRRLRHRFQKRGHLRGPRAHAARIPGRRLADLRHGPSSPNASRAGTAFRQPEGHRPDWQIFMMWHRAILA